MDGIACGGAGPACGAVGLDAVVCGGRVGEFVAGFAERMETGSEKMGSRVRSWLGNGGGGGGVGGGVGESEVGAGDEAVKGGVCVCVVCEGGCRSFFKRWSRTLGQLCFFFFFFFYW